MDDKRNELIPLFMSQFLRIVNKYSQMHNKAMAFGIDVKLLPGEIHTIEAIGRHEGVNITGLAQILGITKGGVSQMVSRLSRKKLLAKTRDPGSDREVRLVLTELGRKAYQGHIDFHSAMYDDFAKDLSHAGAKEINMFREILGKAEKYIDRIVKGLG